MFCESPKPDPRAIARALRELPPPEPAAAEVSARLVERIRSEIAAVGTPGIPFSRFMELALYAPQLGYYSAGSRKFGAEGDFITAPELSPLFSRCLARQCAEVLAVTGGAVLEFGAGTGVMAAELLAELARLDRLPTEYFILEVSADLRARQAATLRERQPELAGRVRWLEGWPEAFTGVIVANEVLDAMPVSRFRVEAGAFQELFVDWADEGFIERAAAPDPRLAEALGRLGEAAEFAEGYSSELSLVVADWVASLADSLERGAAFLIDYGFPRHEFYHPQRRDGTLMCHYRHRAHADPYLWVGLQDITSHVDFTAVAEAASAAGLHVAGFTNQANFLLANGLTELLVTEDPREQLAQAVEVRRLTLPSEMGELFKVMALTRAVDEPLSGFALRDDRFRL